mmetsp:Transcript_1253/g.5421  ORF Transcript_1253/g.5421 Transcript_1253/m.5421 type:complete len:216 (+) Transcript_1253:2630-3277(+)
MRSGPPRVPPSGPPRSSAAPPRMRVSRSRRLAPSADSAGPPARGSTRLARTRRSRRMSATPFGPPLRARGDIRRTRPRRTSSASTGISERSTRSSFNFWPTASSTRSTQPRSSRTCTSRSTSSTFPRPLPSRASCRPPTFPAVSRRCSCPRALRGGPTAANARATRGSGSRLTGPVTAPGIRSRTVRTRCTRGDARLSTTARRSGSAWTSGTVAL